MSLFLFIYIYYIILYILHSYLDTYISYNTYLLHVTRAQASCDHHMSHEKNPLTFHYAGWLIGILIMVYYNPHIIG